MDSRPRDKDRCPLTTSLTPLILDRVLISTASVTVSGHWSVHYHLRLRRPHCITRNELQTPARTSLPNTSDNQEIAENSDDNYRLIHGLFHIALVISPI